MYTQKRTTPPLGLSRWAVLALTAMLWIALSFGIYNAMVEADMGAVWQVLVPLCVWWIVYVGLVRFVTDGFDLGIED